MPSEADQFDPYHQWLGIKPKYQPPHHYRLLGIDLLEEDLQVIENAADQRMAHVRTFAAGKHSEISQRILNELSAAKICLLVPEKKKSYDDKIKAKLAQAKKQATVKVAKVTTVNQAQSSSGFELEKPLAVATPLAVNSSPTSSINTTFSSHTRARKKSNQLPLIVGAVVGVVVIAVIGIFAISGNDEPETGQNTTSKKKKQNKNEANSKINNKPIPKPGKPSNSNHKKPKDNKPSNKNPKKNTNGSKNTKDPFDKKNNPPKNLPQATLAELLQPKKNDSLLILEPEGFLDKIYCKLRQSLTQQKEMNRSIAFSNNTRIMAVGRNDGAIHLWDLQKNEIVSMLSQHRGPVRTVLFSKDDQQLYSASDDKTIKVWDLHQEKVSHTFSDHQAPVTCLAFSKDGRRLASASDDKTVKLWDLVDGKLAKTLSDYKCAMSIVAFSMDDLFIATAGNSPTIWVHELDTDKKPLLLTSHTDTINCVTFSRYDGSLISASKDKTLKIWDSQTGKLLKTLADHQTPVVAVRVAPNGLYFASVDDKGNAIVWDAAYNNRKTLPSVTTAQVNSLAFDSASRQLAFCGSDKNINLWEITFTTKDTGTIATNNPDADDPSSPQVPVKNPIPKPEDQQNTLAELKNLFQRQYTLSSKNSDAKRNFAKQLYQHGLETKSKKATEKYVFYTEALQFAAQTGNVSLALQIVDDLETNFDLGPWQLRLTTIKKLAETVKSTDLRSELSQIAFGYAEQTLQENQFKFATTFSQIAQSLATKARNGEVVRAAKEMIKTISDRNKQWVKVEKAKKTLAESPDDPEANLILGRYHCLVLGDWKAGAVYLAKTPNKKFFNIAQLEANNPVDADEQVKLGDAWMAYSKSVAKPEKEESIANALQWYRIAAPQLTGINKIKIEKFLKENQTKTNVKPKKVVISGLVGYWKMNEGRGTRIRDSKGKLHGIIKGNTRWVREKKTSTVAFTGDDVYVAMPKADFGKTFTIAIWIKPKQKTGRAILITNQASPGNFRSPGKGFRLYFNDRDDSSGRLSFTSSNGDDSKTAHSQGGAVIDNRWQHVAVTVDRTNGKVQLYHAGKNVTVDSDLLDNFETNATWRIGANLSYRWRGRNRGGMRDEYHGQINGLRIYKRVLTDKEIATLAGSGS